MDQYAQFSDDEKKTVSNLPNLHVYSDLIRKVKLCQTLLTSLSEINQKLVNPLSPFVRKKIRNLISPYPTPSDEHKNLDVGI